MKQIFIEEGNEMQNELLLVQNKFRDNEINHREEVRKLEEEWKAKLKLCEAELGARLRKSEEEMFIKIRKLEDESAAKIKKLDSEAGANRQRLESELLSAEREKRKLVEENGKKSTEVVAYKDIIESQK